jgi:hypothetical protein
LLAARQTEGQIVDVSVGKQRRSAMERIRMWVASRPAAAGVFFFVVALIAAACKSGGSSGY